MQARHPQTRSSDTEGMSGSITSAGIWRILRTLALICSMNVHTSILVDVGSGDNRVCLVAHLLLMVAFATGMEVSHTRCIAGEGFCMYVIKNLLKSSKYMTKGDEREPEVINEDITKVNTLRDDATHAYVFWRSWVVDVKMALGKAWTLTPTLQVKNDQQGSLFCLLSTSLAS